MELDEFLLSLNKVGAGRSKKAAPANACLAEITMLQKFHIVALGVIQNISSNCLHKYIDIGTEAFVEDYKPPSKSKRSKAKGTRVVLRSYIDIFFGDALRCYVFEGAYKHVYIEKEIGAVFDKRLDDNMPLYLKTISKISSQTSEATDNFVFKTEKSSSVYKLEENTGEVRLQISSSIDLHKLLS